MSSLLVGEQLDEQILTLLRLLQYFPRIEVHLPQLSDIREELRRESESRKKCLLKLLQAIAYVAPVIPENIIVVVSFPVLIKVKKDLGELGEFSITFPLYPESSEIEAVGQLEGKNLGKLLAEETVKYMKSRLGLDLHEKKALEKLERFFASHAEFPIRLKDFRLLKPRIYSAVADPEFYFAFALAPCVAGVSEKDLERLYRRYVIEHLSRWLLELVMPKVQDVVSLGKLIYTYATQPR